jgi:hypothetical protein
MLAATCKTKKKTHPMAGMHKLDMEVGWLLGELEEKGWMSAKNTTAAEQIERSGRRCMRHMFDDAELAQKLWEQLELPQQVSWCCRRTSRACAASRFT